MGIVGIEYHKGFRRYWRHKEELEQEGEMALVRAAGKFDPSRGQYSTYAGAVVRNAMRKAANRIRAKERVESCYLDSESEEWVASGESAENENFLTSMAMKVRFVRESAERGMKERHKEFIHLWADCQENCAEIAERYGYSVQGVCKVINKFKGRFKEIWEEGVFDI